MRLTSRLFLTMLVCAALGILMACTANERARRFGGKQTIQLEKCKKFEDIGWKEDSLWILVRELKPEDRMHPQTYVFKEHSSYGIVEGMVTIKEQIDQSCPTPQ